MGALWLIACSQIQTWFRRKVFIISIISFPIRRVREKLTTLVTSARLTQWISSHWTQENRKIWQNSLLISLQSWRKCLLIWYVTNCISRSESCHYSLSQVIINLTKWAVHSAKTQIRLSLIWVCCEHEETRSFNIQLNKEWRIQSDWVDISGWFESANNFRPVDKRA